jgi:SAM-dependent methyltransferase
MAAALIGEYGRPGQVVCDPFSGCGTFALEAWLAGCHVIANDLSPYAHLLTRAKLYPYQSLDDALADLAAVAKSVARRRTRPDLRKVPLWVRDFFHPRTLKETLAWTEVLMAQERWFLLACLMGILHHQRPGFLSFPSSHTVPYLRVRKFPRHRFPHLYEYRSVLDRLDGKVRRAFKRQPNLHFALRRQCASMPAEDLNLGKAVDLIITSPPYMRQLDYGRDNRLRLWFLGCRDWHSLDQTVSPDEKSFLDLMNRCFARWHTALKPKGHCVLVIGDQCSREGRKNLPEAVSHIAIAEHGFHLVSSYADMIPNERRVRRGITGSTSETVLVLRRAAT